MGMIEGANPPAVAIACSSTGPSDGGNSGPIIVTVSGLDPGASVTVEDGNGNGLTLTQNGSAAFGAVLAAGTPYDVTVTAPPAGEMCSVGMGTGTTMAGMSPMVGLTCTASPGSGAGTGATAIAAGESHTCAVLEGGVQCWGSNASNQLGQLTPGAPPISAVPVPVAEVGSAQNMIVAGLNHTCVVVDEGMPSVDCWGDNTYGQLGYGSPGEGGGQPGEVMNLGGNIMGLAAGAHHTCALVSGYIYCWGDNSSNQLGWDAGAMSSLPGQVSVVVEATFVTAGQDFTCAGNFLNQTVYCWGNNVDGQFANGMMASSPTPTPATEIDPLFFSQMSAGDEYACGVNTNGPSAVVDCWGTNASGELGNGSLATPQPAPGSVDFGGTALSSSVTIAASLGDPSIPVAGHTCLLDGLATIYCWGAGSAGQLGNGLAMIAADTPVMVNSFGGATAIAVGVQHSCGINLTGQVYCWGANMSGQLGDGTTMSSATPMPVTFP
jgi:alpha-tubulin suppressor-like RCC1 family protein